MKDLKHLYFKLFNLDYSDLAIPNALWEGWLCRAVMPARALKFWCQKTLCDHFFQILLYLGLYSHYFFLNCRWEYKWSPSCEILIVAKNDFFSSNFKNLIFLIFKWFWAFPNLKTILRVFENFFGILNFWKFYGVFDIFSWNLILKFWTSANLIKFWLFFSQNLSQKLWIIFWKLWTFENFMQFFYFFPVKFELKVWSGKFYSE